MKATILRDQGKWIRPEKRRLPVLRMTARYLILDAHGTEAWFDRSTGQGERARGGKGGGLRGASWGEWRLTWRDWSKVFAEAD
jgi:hypothetical protein